MQDDRLPKVFISYSWSSDWLVLPLAERLVSHGVDVILDKWDLKEGQDKYTFMEQCVNNPDVTKVLIVCDKKYAEKANNRTGGVGDETVIISSEVYGKMTQEKFIPVIAEHNEDGSACVPTYIKTRIYVDLSDPQRYEDEYEKLLRNIYEKPLYSKPKLGSRPDWIDEEKTNLFPLADLVRQIKGTENSKKQQSCAAKFIDEYIRTMKEFRPDAHDGESIYKQFIDTKPIRDIFLDFLQTIDETELSSSDYIGSAIEKMYNNLTNVKGFDPDAISANERSYELFHIHIWELFICIIAYYRHTQDYASIHHLLVRTYFLSTSCFSDSVAPVSYCRFRHHSNVIEDEYKPTTVNKNKYTLLGNTICTEREKLPIYTKEALAEADLFLYQIANALPLIQDDHWWGAPYWFPTLYVYAKKSPDEWTMMKSKRICEKLFPLFGVSSIDELKDAIKECVPDRDMRYRGGFDSAPAILSTIKLEEIGSLN